MTEEQQLLHSSVEHLHGPEEVSYAEDELIVVCLVRDGRLYEKSFVEHYFSLGVKHIAFLDNGSTDGTVEFLKNYDNVTVLRTMLPYKEYKYLMKQYLIDRFGKKDRWCLYVDQDELFDYPYSDVIGLDSLLRYLNERSYTAVAAQMLDMFPEESLLSNRADNLDEPLKELHRFYDVSNISRENLKEHHHSRNTMLENEEIEFFSGGIRENLFGIRPYLTKHPLVFSDGRVKQPSDSSHWVDNARIADITCVLFHYKFAGDFREQVERAVREENYHANSREYKKYLKVLENSPSLQIKQESFKELEGVNDLLEERFLVVSEDYVRWVDAEEEKSLFGAAVATKQDEESRRMAEALLKAKRQERATILKMQSRETIRELHKAEQHARHLEQQLEEHSLKTQKLERQLHNSIEIRKKFQRRARDLQKRLETIEASRAWKLMKAPHRLKVRISSLGRGGSS